MAMYRFKYRIIKTHNLYKPVNNKMNDIHLCVVVIVVIIRYLSVVKFY